MQRQGSGEGKKAIKSLVEIALCLLIAIVLVGIVQQFFFAPIDVVGESMMPTIAVEDDRVFLQKRFYKIDRDDVIVFYRPNSGLDEDNNPAEHITISDFINSLPFINKIPQVADHSGDNTEGFTCVIKRVIGIEGDEIKIVYEGTNQAVLYRNGKKVSDFTMNRRTMYLNLGVNEGTWIVGEDEYFVLGDNRDNSYDSEDYGCIKSHWIVGKVLLARLSGKYTISL